MSLSGNTYLRLEKFQNVHLFASSTVNIQLLVTATYSLRTGSYGFGAGARARPKSANPMQLFIDTSASCLTCCSDFESISIIMLNPLRHRPQHQSKLKTILDAHALLLGGNASAKWDRCQKRSRKLWGASRTLLVLGKPWKKLLLLKDFELSPLKA